MTRSCLHRWMPLAVLLCLASLAWPGSVHAVTVDRLGGSYGYGLATLELGAGGRDSDLGLGGEAGYGWPYAGRNDEALEISLRGLTRKRDSGGRDGQQAIFGHWVRDIGGHWFGGAVPFVLFGVGAIREDVRGDDSWHFGMDGGLGGLYPIGYRGLAVRVQVTAQAQANDQSIPGDDFIIDFHFKAGLQIPIGGRILGRRHAAPEYPPGTVCENRVVDPVSGRASCINDADRDGIPDRSDQCPGTEFGEVVAADGCKVQPVADSDADGVLDAIDACPDSAAGMRVDASGCLVAQTVTLKAIQFLPASARLTRDARLATDRIALTLNNQPGLAVDIVGHTDSEGDAAFNLELSRLRAESVRQRLIRRGVSPERLRAIGRGESTPVADNATEEGRAENRRVEFQVNPL